MDPGRPKNQSSRNRTNPEPLRWAVAFIPSIYFFPQMDTVCESDPVLIDFPIGKNSNWSKSACRTTDIGSTTGDVSGTRVTQFRHFRAELDRYENDTWHCTGVTRGSPYVTWPNDRMTCGSTYGRWLYGC